MISEKNPIHRLKEIQRELQRLVQKLVPLYVWQEENGFPVESLESLPVFREPWLQRAELEKEADQIMIRLALSYERAPTSEAVFE